MVYLKLLATAVIWGGTFTAGRVIALKVGPFTGSFIRFVLATAVLIIFIRRLEGKLPSPNRRDLLTAALLGATGIFAYNVFFFLGMQTVEAGRASLIVATNPVFIFLFSVVIFNEPLTGFRGLGVVLSLVGAAIVITAGNPFVFASAFGRGELLIFGCVISWVAYSLIGKSAMRSLSPPVAVTCASLLGTIALFFPALAEGQIGGLAGLTFTDWAALAYLGIFGTAVGFVWYYEGIKEIGASRAAVFINFVPVSAVISGWLILNEPLTISLVSGALLVTGGVYLMNRERP